MNKITFVSLGPGDPELITLKALNSLQEADIILAPSTSGRNKRILSRSRDIMSSLKIEDEKIKLFNIPMNSNRTDALEDYRALVTQATEYYSKGLKVAIVAEGDSGFYSSCQYINEILIEMNISTKKVAGVPAFIACGAFANIHIAKQSEQVLIVPGKTDFDELAIHLTSRKTIVIMKPSLCEDIIKELAFIIDGRKYHYFENIGISEKEFYSSDKTEIKSRKFPYFSLLIMQNKIFS